MAGRCFSSYIPAPFHSKSYSNLIHMVEMDRSFLCVHWNINRDVKFEFLLHELNRIVFFSLRKNNRNDTIHDRQSFSYWVLHFSTTTLNWVMQITRVTHCHAGYQASFFKAPKKTQPLKNFTFAGTRRAAWQTKSISGFGALCCVFSVFSAAREK